MSHEAKVQKHLGESLSHLDAAIRGIEEGHKTAQIDLELWRAHSKAEFTVFVLSINDEDRSWATKERFRKSASALDLLQEAKELIEESMKSSGSRARERLERLWKAESRLIHVRKLLDKQASEKSR